MKRKRRAAAAADSGVLAIDLGPRAVELHWRRSTRRSCALQVDEGGVRLAAPRSMPHAAMKEFVLSHRDWLLDCLQRADDSARQARIELVDGARIPYLGRQLRLRISDCETRSAAGGTTEKQDEIVELQLHGADEPAQSLRAALQERALVHYRARVEHYCGLLALTPPPVRLSNARTRWGSCSLRSGIRLHWRLIHLEPELIDYVVAHEVAHLREMNHSPRFWAIVESVYPQWRSARKRLHEAAPRLPRFDRGH